jgi:hypothetical protein
MGFEAFHPYSGNWVRFDSHPGGRIARRTSFGILIAAAIA